MKTNDKKAILRMLFLKIVFVMILEYDFGTETITECLNISKRTFSRWKAVSKQKTKRTRAFDLRQSVILSILSSSSTGQCMGRISLSGIRLDSLPAPIFNLLLNKRIYREQDPYDVAFWVDKALESERK